ncbi:hypothetical protein [Erwinia billingiae]|uniref:hypothetical protein n=1 Tax=Erwinia billingiae TaxID=182337 RepID=UPI002246BADA|nr:hypothetical protein [Erwinia billingiae]
MTGSQRQGDGSGCFLIGILSRLAHPCRRRRAAYGLSDIPTRQALYRSGGRLNTLLDGAAGSPLLLGLFIAGGFRQGFIPGGTFFLRGILTRFFNAFRSQLCFTGFCGFYLALRPCYVTNLRPDFTNQLRFLQTVLLLLLVEDGRERLIRMLHATTQLGRDR